MDLNVELNNLSKRIEFFKNRVKGEQATINAFVIPFIRLLGYDDTDPTEVVHQFTADIGTKKDEKVDHAILKDGEVIMIIECKDCRSNLSKENMSQLYRYFGVVTEARIGVLTNGILYRFYTDLNRPNVMDTDPFFEINMLEIHPSVVNVLNHLTKDKFDLDITRSSAIDLKHRSEIKEILRKQLNTPTNDIVEFFHRAIKSQVEKQDFTDIVKRAFNEFLDEEKSIQENGIDGKEQSKKDAGDEQLSNGTDEKFDRIRKKELKLTNIKVTMPDGSVIYHHNGNDTYLEALEKLGLEEVMRVRPNIVSTEQFSHAIKGVKRGKYWVRGGQKFSTGAKIRELNKIASLLNISLLVERIEKKSKSG